jgi:hypothetical protein
MWTNKRVLDRARPPASRRVAGEIKTGVQEWKARDAFHSCTPVLGTESSLEQNRLHHTPARFKRLGGPLLTAAPGFTVNKARRKWSSHEGQPLGNVPQGLNRLRKKGPISGEIPEKRTAGAEALIDLIGFVPGMNPRPTARTSFSAACSAQVFIGSLWARLAAASRALSKHPASLRL